MYIGVVVNLKPVHTLAVYEPKMNHWASSWKILLKYWEKEDNLEKILHLSWEKNEILKSSKNILTNFEDKIENHMNIQILAQLRGNWIVKKQAQLS